MAKADIDFEKELWDAANELRGAVSENNYKNYILPLVFVKHLSERYEVVREEPKEQLNDPKSDYYTTTFTDSQLRPGITYHYRVVATDSDESSVFSNEVSILPADGMKDQMAKSISIYPNPSAEELRIL